METIVSIIVVASLVSAGYCILSRQRLYGWLQIGLMLCVQLLFTLGPVAVLLLRDTSESGPGRGTVLLVVVGTLVGIKINSRLLQRMDSADRGGRR